MNTYNVKKCKILIHSDTVNPFVYWYVWSYAPLLAFLTQDVEHNTKEEEFVDGQEEDQEASQEASQEVAAVKDNDSSDGAVLINGHDEADEEWLIGWGNVNILILSLVIDSIFFNCLL